MTPVWSILFNVVPVQFNVCSRLFGNTHHVRFITGAWLKEATVALPFKTCCHREGCDVGSSLPSTANQKLAGSTEIWNGIAGFKVQSANHYTIEPRAQQLEVCALVFVWELTVDTSYVIKRFCVKFANIAYNTKRLQYAYVCHLWGKLTLSPQLRLNDSNINRANKRARYLWVQNILFIKCDASVVLYQELNI